MVDNEDEAAADTAADTTTAAAAAAAARKDAGGAETTTAAPSQDEARDRALALLEAAHAFPCEYTLTVIAFKGEPITEAVKAAVAGGVPDVEHKIIESKAGKYLSHRFAVKATGAAHVLEIYARIRTVDGVVTIL